MMTTILRTLMILTAITIGSVAFATDPAEGPIELKMRFDMEESLLFDLTQRNEISQTQFGVKSSVVTRNTNLQRFEVIERRDNGQFVLQMKNEAVKFALDAEAYTLEYDSTNPKDKSKLSDPTVKGIAATVGLEVHFLMDETGSIHNVLNLDEIQQWVENLQDPMMQMTLQMLTEKETLISMNEMNYKMLPDHAVEVGDTWDKSFSMPLQFGQLNINCTLELQKLRQSDRGAIADIALTGSIGFAGDEGLIQIKNPLLVGKMVFNRDSGFFDQMDMDIGYDMVVNGDAANTISMKQGITWSLQEE